MVISVIAVAPVLFLLRIHSEVTCVYDVVDISAAVVACRVMLRELPFAVNYKFILIHASR